MVVNKLKALADDKLDIAKMIIFLFDRVENTMAKRRKCWLGAFSAVCMFFSKRSSWGGCSVWVMW